MASGQSLAWKLKAESCEDAGTWRNVGKLLLSEGSESFFFVFEVFLILYWQKSFYLELAVFFS